MKNIKLKTIIFCMFILFSGCVEETPEVTPTPAVTETATPTVIPTTPTPLPTPVREPNEYRVNLDNYYGFYRVVNVNSSKAANFDRETKILIINASDRVIWINDADDPEEPLTIVSEENLWDKSETRSILRWRYKQFNHTFDTSGTYNFYIKEYPRIIHLKIIVNP